MSSEALVEDLRISALPLAETAAVICHNAGSGAAQNVFTLNLDHVVKMRKNAIFRAAYSRAGLITVIVVAVLHVDELREPRWLLLARGADLAPAVRASVLAALLLGVLPILEEWSRGFRYARLNAAEAREPVADPRP